jgi:ABC-2 type transport system ATP-binding protein
VKPQTAWVNRDPIGGYDPTMNNRREDEGIHVATTAELLSGGISSTSAARGPAGDDRPAGEPVITVRGLRKSYGSTEAVVGIDLDVYPGEVFAFLGPNGAGKTTTVEILEGYRHRNAGEVSVLGVDPADAGGDWRARIGVVLQESTPEAELTVQECVARYAGYYPKPRSVPETLALVGLDDRPNIRCRRLSGGQRRRLDVALALIGDPELVFLDEPTTGFDPAARRSAWDVIAGLRDLGKTIFLTTHYMEEAEHLADRIAVISAGRIVAEGTAANLGGRDVKASVISFTLPSGLSAADLPPAVAGCLTGHDGDKIEASTPSPLPVLGAMAAWAEERKINLPDLQVIRPTLEEIYLQLTKESQ